MPAKFSIFSSQCLCSLIWPTLLPVFALYARCSRVINTNFVSVEIGSCCMLSSFYIIPWALSINNYGINNFFSISFFSSLTLYILRFEIKMQLHQFPLLFLFSNCSHTPHSLSSSWHVLKNCLFICVHILIFLAIKIPSGCSVHTMLLIFKLSIWY